MTGVKEPATWYMPEHVPEVVITPVNAVSGEVKVKVGVHASVLSATTALMFSAVPTVSAPGNFTGPVEMK